MYKCCPKQQDIFNEAQDIHVPKREVHNMFLSLLNMINYSTVHYQVHQDISPSK